MDITRRLASATELERLIHGGRFLYAAQPILPVRGAGDVKPDWYDWQIRPQFLPELVSYDVIDAVESLGLGEELDLRVTRDAIDWLEQSSSDARLTLALSSRGLSSSRLFSSLDEWLADSGVRPQQLCFDIAVHTALRDLSGATRFLKNVRSRGARVVLDSGVPGNPVLGLFGPLRLVDYVRIDGRWLAGGSRSGDATLESLVDYARSLHIPILAQGVDTPEQLDRLKRMGVDYYQGMIGAAPGVVARRDSAAEPLQLVG